MSTTDDILSVLASDVWMTSAQVHSDMDKWAPVSVKTRMREMAKEGIILQRTKEHNGQTINEYQKKPDADRWRRCPNPECELRSACANPTSCASSP